MLQHSLTTSAGAVINPILSPGNPKGLEMVPTLMALGPYSKAGGAKGSPLGTSSHR
jgi:hypothetical protein